MRVLSTYSRLDGCAAPEDSRNLSRSQQITGTVRARAGAIDAMLAANPEIPIAAIWERLVDEHAATVAYPTLRTYVASRRALRA
jgi:hypothetical protein